MGVFGNLKSEGLEKTEDRLGGFAPLESDAYEATIKLAYAGKSAKGALSLNIVADLGGREYRETLWVSNAKGENWWVNDNNKKVPLPGFTVANDLCLVTTDKTLDDQNTEEKIVKIYDFEEKKEVPKSVDVLVDMIGQKVTLGILKNLENKTQLQGNEYIAIADTRDTNTIEKVFHYPTGMTVNEATSDKPEANFLPSWTERNKGKTRDRRSIKDGQAGSSGRPGGGAPAAGGGERRSLFGNKEG